MERLITLLLGIMLCGGQAAEAELSHAVPDPAPVRIVYDCHRANHAPVIDGDLSDECWQVAGLAAIRLPGMPASSGYTPGADVRLLWDDVYLYFAATVRDDTPRANHHERDDPVWNDDCFEIYLNSSGDGRTYYELDFNANGAIWDSMGLPHHTGRLQLIRAWSSASLEVRTRVVDGGWTIEGRIRFDELVGADHVPPRHDDRWPANLYYLDAPAGGREPSQLAWNPTDRFNDISQFGELRFVDYAGDAQRRRDQSLARRLLDGRLLRAGQLQIERRSDVRVFSPKAGDYGLLADGMGWRPNQGFGRVTVAVPEDQPPQWRVQPNAGDDPTFIEWSVTDDGMLVVIARLTPAAAQGNREGGGDGVWLSTQVQDHQATLHLRDTEWSAATVKVCAGQRIRICVDAGPAGSYAYDFTQLAVLLLPPDALDSNLPEGWTAFGAFNMATGRQAADAGDHHAIHVRGTDHFTGASSVMPVVPGAKLYRITGAVRSELVGTTRGHVGIDYLDSEGNFIRQASTRVKMEDYLRWGLYNVSGSNPWTRFVTHAYDVPSNAHGLSVWVGVNAWESPDGAGDVWFADVQVQAVQPDESYPLGFPPMRWTMDDLVTTRQGEFQLSHTPIERYQLPTMPPLAENDDSRLPILAWPGTAAPTSFTIHARLDLNDVRVEVSDLRGNGEAVISASAIAVRKVCYLYRKAALMSTHEYLLSPNHLEPFDSLKVSAGEAQQCWLTVRVPADAPVGRYIGEVRVILASGRTKVMAINLDVLPIVPQTRPGLLSGVYCYYLPQDTPKMARAMLDDMADHGMTCAFLFNGNYRLPVETDSHGRAMIQWDQPNQLAEFFEAYRQAGFTQTLLMITPHSILNAARAAGPRFAEVYADLFRQIREQGALRGWASFAVVPCDEGYPYPFSDDRFQMTSWSAPALRAADVPMALHAMNHPTSQGWRFERQFENATDVILTTFYHPPGCGPAYRGYRSWDQYRDAMRSQGKRVMFYNPDTTGVNPESMRFAYGVGLWKLKADGMADWHYCEHPRGEAYSLGRVQGRTPMNFIFPPTAEHAGGPTIGWEAAREGAKDYQVLYTLDRLIVQARQSGDGTRQELARRADEDVRTILDKIRFDTIDTVGDLTLPRWQRRSVDDQGVARVHGEFKIANGLELEDYGHLRSRACHWIMELSK